MKTCPQVTLEHNQKHQKSKGWRCWSHLGQDRFHYSSTSLSLFNLSADWPCVNQQGDSKEGSWLREHIDWISSGKERPGYNESQIRWQLEQLRPKDQILTNRQFLRKIFKLSGFPLVFPPPTHPSYFALESLFWGHHSDKDRIENREWTAWSFILWLICYRQVRQTKKNIWTEIQKRKNLQPLLYYNMLYFSILMSSYQPIFLRKKCKFTFDEQFSFSLKVFFKIVKQN